MKAEELLKNISSLLKKHEDFLNNNPEMFYAIQDRLVKASDDEEDSDYDWANIGKDENQDEGDDESGYGDELFDKIPSDEGEDEDQQYIRESNGEDDGEDDDASRWLREHGGDTGDEDQSGFDYDPEASRESDEEGYTPDANEDADVQRKVQKVPEGIKGKNTPSYKATSTFGFDDIAEIGKKGDFDAQKDHARFLINRQKASNQSTKDKLHKLIDSAKDSNDLQTKLYNVHEAYSKATGKDLAHRHIEGRSSTSDIKNSSGRMVDWKPQDKYAPEHQKAIEAAMKEGYSHREAERMAGAHKAPSDFYGALRGSTRPSEPSSKMLEQLKGHAHGWLKNAEAKAAENAEAEVNPVKYASGKAIASHDAAHKDFDAAHNEFLQSDNLKGLAGRARHQAIQSWKKDWEEKNPQHREKAIAAADTGKVFSEATKARDERRKEGEQAILGAGKSFGTGTTGEYSQAAAGGDDEPISGQAAGQMVGGEKSDEGGYTTNIKTDPAAVFAERNPEYVKHLQSKLNPDQQQRLSGINAIKIKKGTP